MGVKLPTLTHAHPRYPTHGALVTVEFLGTVRQVGKRVYGSYKVRQFQLLEGCTDPPERRDHAALSEYQVCWM